MIAAINGAAAGIGITGMLAADIRIAADDAKLVLNFAELGVMPGMGSTWFLPRRRKRPRPEWKPYSASS